MSRTAIIGDVHGMRAELERMLVELELVPGDHLVSVGDLIRKGPDTPGVFRVLRETQERGVLVDFVLGNHEAKLWHHLRDANRGSRSIRELAKELSTEDLEWIARAPLHLTLTDHRAIIVHGGILPTWEDLPSHDPTVAFAGDADRMDAILRTRHLSGFAPRLHVTRIRADGMRLRTRILRDDAMLPEAPEGGRLEIEEVQIPRGSPIPLGSEGLGDPYWAEIYDGRFGHAYCGHHPFMMHDAPVQFPHATALDLGCVYGRFLAAVVLEEGREPVAVTVRATGARARWSFD